MGVVPILRGDAASLPAPAGDEARLVRRAREGDAAAIEALYLAHVDRVHRFAFSRLHDDAEARDVAQDVFVSALHGLPGLRADDRFGPWLMRIAHVTILGRWRRTGRGPRLVALDDDPEVPDGGTDPASHDDVARDVQRRLDGAAIGAALGRLTDLQQQVVTLRFIAELSVADTAAAVGCTQDAVKKLQRRGLASLRMWLEREAEG